MRNTFCLGFQSFSRSFFSMKRSKKKTQCGHWDWNDRLGPVRWIDSSSSRLIPSSRYSTDAARYSNRFVNQRKDRRLWIELNAIAAGSSGFHTLLHLIARESGLYIYFFLFFIFLVLLLFFDRRARRPSVDQFVISFRTQTEREECPSSSSSSSSFFYFPLHFLCSFFFFSSNFFLTGPRIWFYWISLAIVAVVVVVVVCFALGLGPPYPLQLSASAADGSNPLESVSPFDTLNEWVRG